MESDLVAGIKVVVTAEVGSLYLGLEGDVGCVLPEVRPGLAALLEAHGQRWDVTWPGGVSVDKLQCSRSGLKNVLSFIIFLLCLKLIVFSSLT